MSIIQSYSAVLTRNQEELAITLSENDVEAIEQLMNGVFFNHPDKISFCFNTISKLKDAYHEGKNHFSGYDLLNEVLLKTPEAKIKLIESGMARVINTSFDYDKTYGDYQEKQNYIDAYVKRFEMVKFDGRKIKYLQGLINHLISVTDRQFKASKVDSKDEFLDKQLLPIVELFNYDVYDKVEESISSKWNLSRYGD